MTQRFDLARITVLEHQLTELFGSPARFGVPTPLPPGLMADAGKVVLAIAAADGRLSDRERETFLGIMRAYGVSEDEVRAVGAYVPDNKLLDGLVEKGTPPFLRALVYDAVRVARVDGFHAKERETTERVVKKLGLDVGLVAGIEALLKIEDSVAGARNSLLDPPPALPVGWETTRTADGLNARGEQFGNAGAIALPREFHLAMCKAVLSVAAADRDLTEPELIWWAGFAKTLGTPVDVLEEALKVDYQSVPFEQVFDRRLAPYSRVALYSALKCARADGVSEDERDMAVRGARRFGLEETFVTALINQLDIESGVREARIGMLAPLR